MDQPKNIAYIDGANLHRGSQELGFELDYKKFHDWLCQKYSLEKVYLFMGFIPKYQGLYSRFQSYGYTMAFKETATNKAGITKGNCDAELILKVVSDYYEKAFDFCILVSGDGDFKCLIDFLNERGNMHSVVSPARHRSSYLIRKIKVPLIFLNDHYHKFSKPLETEKAPDADVSA